MIDRQLLQRCPTMAARPRLALATTRPTTELLEASRSLQAAVDRIRAPLARAEGTALGEGLIKIREAGIDALEAVFAEGLRRFDQSGAYAADGTLGIVPWCRTRQPQSS